MKIDMLAGTLVLALISSSSWAAGRCQPDAAFPSAGGRLGFDAYGFVSPPGAPAGFFENSNPRGDANCFLIYNSDARQAGSLPSWLETSMPSPGETFSQWLRINYSRPPAGGGYSAQMTFWRVDFAGANNNSGTLSLTLFPYLNRIQVQQTRRGTVVKTDILPYSNLSPGVPCADLMLRGDVIDGNAVWTVDLVCQPPGSATPTSTQRATYSYAFQQHHTAYLGLLNPGAVNGEYEIQVLDY